MINPTLVPLNKILPNPWQPRQSENPDAVGELAASIVKNGLMQIPSARQVNGKYQLAFGHSRLAAYRALADVQSGYSAMPLIVRELTDLQMFEFALAENIHRNDLTHIEKAKAMRRYMDEFHKTSEETAEFFNVTAETVRGTIRFLNAPQEAQDKLEAGEINVREMRGILTVARVNPEKAVELTQDLSSNKVNPGQIDDRIEEAIKASSGTVRMQERSWNGSEDNEDDKPFAGPDLWPLDWKHKGLAPLKSSDVMKMLGIKMAELSEEIAEQMNRLIESLNAGMVGDPAAFPDLNQEAVESLIALANPPTCTACPLHIVMNGSHYCGQKACHDRKKAAWLASDMKKLSKEMGLEIYTEGRIVDVFQESYDDYAHTYYKRIKAKDKDLQLMIRRVRTYNQYPVTKHRHIAIVDLSVKRAQAIKKENEQKAATRAAGNSEDSEREARRKLEQEKRRASGAFINLVAGRVFSVAFDGLKNIPAMMALLEVQSFESPAGIKKMTKPAQTKALQIALACGVLEEIVDYRTFEHGPVATAKHLQGVATTWGVKLPADWLEVAETFEPKTEGKAKRGK